MSLGFNDLPAEAIKSKIDYYKFENGENSFRIVGNVLPRYVYWEDTPDGNKTMNVECLAFDRDEVRFLNREKDWFAHYFPGAKCSWSYLCKAFNEEGKLEVLVLKKKMFGDIKTLATKHLGDITHPDTGSIIVVERKKTGPLPFNVEYTLDQMSCEMLPLTDEQKEEVADSPTIEEMFPRPTPEEQRVFIEKIWFSAPAEEEATTDSDSLNAMDDDDIPM